MDFRKTKEYTPNKEKNVTEVVNDPNHEYMFYDIKSDIEKITNFKRVLINSWLESDSLIYNAYNKEKLTQKKLAEKIGARTPLIGALESENNPIGISIYNLYMISQVLNVPINKFFEEE